MKKKNLLLFILPLVILTSCDKKSSESTTESINNQSSSEIRIEKIKELQNKIDKEYADSNKTFVSESVTTDKISDLEKEVGKLDSDSKEKVKPNLDILKKKFVETVEINKLFNEPYISGDKLNTEVAIIDDLSIENVNGIGQKYYTDKEKQSNEKNIKDFELAINSGIDLAKNQINTILQINAQIDSYYQDGVINDSVIEANATDINSQIGNVKNLKAKDELTNKVNKVIQDIRTRDNQIKEKEKEDAKKSAPTPEETLSLVRKRDGNDANFAYNDFGVYSDDKGEFRSVKVSDKSSQAQGGTGMLGWLKVYGDGTIVESGTGPT